MPRETMTTIEAREKRHDVGRGVGRQRPDSMNPGSNT